jgi:hypothetical protein
MGASPEGEIPLHRALTYPISDLALHSWDVHRSQGRLVELAFERNRVLCHPVYVQIAQAIAPSVAYRTSGDGALPGIGLRGHCDKGIVEMTAVSTDRRRRLATAR